MADSDRLNNLKETSNVESTTNDQGPTEIAGPLIDYYPGGSASSYSKEKARGRKAVVDQADTPSNRDLSSESSQSIALDVNDVHSLASGSGVVPLSTMRTERMRQPTVEEVSDEEDFSRKVRYTENYLRARSIGRESQASEEHIKGPLRNEKSWDHQPSPVTESEDYKSSRRKHPIASVDDHDYDSEELSGVSVHHKTSEDDSTTHENRGDQENDEDYDDDDDEYDDDSWSSSPSFLRRPQRRYGWAHVPMAHYDDYPHRNPGYNQFENPFAVPSPGYASYSPAPRPYGLPRYAHIPQAPEPNFGSPGAWRWPPIPPPAPSPQPRSSLSSSQPASPQPPPVKAAPGEPELQQQRYTKSFSDSDHTAVPVSWRRKSGLKSGKRKARRYPWKFAQHGYESLAKGSLLQNHRFSNTYRYTPPYGKYGEQLAIDVTIRSPARKHVLEANSRGPLFRADSDWRHREGMKVMNIIGAKRWFDSEGHHTLDLACIPHTLGDEALPSTSIKWIHVEQQLLDFEDFKSVVLRSDPNLTLDWKIVLLSLFERIRKLHYDRSMDRYSPWSIRADSSDFSLPGMGHSTLSAISIGFPYFALGPALGQNTKNRKHQNPIMTLFEWDERFESAREWDMEQTFRLMYQGTEHKDSIVHVPHVWALAFDHTIITYGQIAFQDLVSESFRVLEVDSTIPRRDNSVEICDLHGQIIAVPLDQCRTFFALKHIINRRCFSNGQHSLNDTDICTPTHQVLSGERWVYILSKDHTGPINLVLRPKYIKTTPTSPTQTTKVDKSETVQDMTTTQVTRAGGAIQADNDKDNANRTLHGTNATIREDQRGSSNMNHESDSGSETDEKRHNSLIPMASCSRIMNESSDTDGAMILYRPTTLVLNKPDMLFASPLSQQNTDENHSMTVYSPEPPDRELIWRNNGLIVFDPAVVDSTPEIYTALPRQEGNFGTNMVQGQLHDETHETSRTDSFMGILGDQRNINGTDNHDQDVQTRITIPHFLSWATNLNSTIEETSSESSVESVMRILEVVHDTLQNMKLQRHDKVYRRSREVAQVDLETVFPFLRGWKPAQLLQIPLQSHESQDTVNPHLFLLADDRSQNDYVRKCLVQTCNANLKELYATVNGLLSLFVPLTSPTTMCHPLLQKCWGAFETMMKSILEGVGNQMPALHYKDPEWWIVRDPTVLGMLSGRRKPTTSWGQCERCRQSTQYKSLREALQHVLVFHYGASNQLNTFGNAEEELLQLWLRNDKQYYDDLRLEHYIHYLLLILEPSREIHTRGRGIWAGVASDSNSMPARFMLPKSLVNAFENVVLLLICAAKSFTIINRCCNPINQYAADPSKTKKDRDTLEAHGKELSKIGRRAKEYIQKAENDVMLMSYTDIDTEFVSYDNVGPEYILGTIMASLFNRPLHAEECIDHVYAGFYRRLHSDAMKHPRTRVLRKIWRMREEIDMIANINMQQQDLLENFICILNPSTFRATTVTRGARYRVEAQFIELQLREIDQVYLRIDDLDSRLEDMSSHVSRMLEIQRESNNNAIIVFTIVTIIFLPLSWATSYLGMNTADIRDLAQGQWLFWVIALPVTAFVIGIAVLVVLKGDSIREFFIMREVRKEQQSVARSEFLVAAQRRLSTRATGGSFGVSRATSRTGPHLWQGFRRRGTGLRLESKV